MVMINHFHHIGRLLLNSSIFITHVGNCVMGATPMVNIAVYIRGLFKYECDQLNNFLHIYATTKCHTFPERTLCRL